MVISMQAYRESHGNGIPALKARVLQEYGNIAAVARKIGMTPQTLGRKLNEKTEFSATEISRIADAMRLTRKETLQYFFWDYEEAQQQRCKEGAKKGGGTDEEICGIIEP